MTTKKSGKLKSWKGRKVEFKPERKYAYKLKSMFWRVFGNWIVGREHPEGSGHFQVYVILQRPHDGPCSPCGIMCDLCREMYDRTWYRVREAMKEIEEEMKKDGYHTWSVTVLFSDDPRRGASYEKVLRYFGISTGRNSGECG